MRIFALLALAALLCACRPRVICREDGGIYTAGEVWTKDGHVYVCMEANSYKAATRK